MLLAYGNVEIPLLTAPTNSFQPIDLLFFFLNFFLKSNISLSCPHAWPKTCYLDQADHKLRAIPLLQLLKCWYERYAPLCQAPFYFSSLSLFMCVGVLYVCIAVHHMCACCPRRPEEDAESPFGFWESNLVPPEEQPTFLTAESSPSPYLLTYLLTNLWVWFLFFIFFFGDICILGWPWHQPSPAPNPEVMLQIQPPPSHLTQKKFWDTTTLITKKEKKNGRHFWNQSRLRSFSLIVTVKCKLGQALVFCSHGQSAVVTPG